MKHSTSKRILLVDDHPMFLDGLDLVLTQKKYEVMTANNAALALQTIEKSKAFDIIFVDLQMPGLDGFAMIQALRERNIFTPVIIMSASDIAEDITRALSLGALGYMSKSVHSDQISHAIKTVINGGVYISPELSYNVSDFKYSPKNAQRNLPHKLSTRQQGILALVSEGYSNKEIALAVDIAEVTVKYHLHAVFQALQVNNRTSCVKKARELGMI